MDVNFAHVFACFMQQKNASKLVFVLTFDCDGLHVVWQRLLVVTTRLCCHGNRGQDSRLAKEKNTLRDQQHTRGTI